jgi:hypothetical protein
MPDLFDTLAAPRQPAPWLDGVYRDDYEPAEHEPTDRAEQLHEQQAVAHARSVSARGSYTLKRGPDGRYWTD